MIVSDRRSLDRLDFLISRDVDSRFLEQISTIPRGSYRWFLCIYANLYDVNENVNKKSCELTTLDKLILIRIYRRLQFVHTINWPRTKLIEVRQDQVHNFLKELFRIIRNTKSFIEFKIALYLIQGFKGIYVVDDYILRHMSNLVKFIR